MRKPSVEDMCSKLRMCYEQFASGMRAAELEFRLTCVARTYDEQVALYHQGRKPLAEVNAYRTRVMMPPITEFENKRVVTWTINSRHLINIPGSERIENDKSRAFDIVLMKHGKAHWDVKADVNDNEIPDYAEAGRIGRLCGLEWGGLFRIPDYPHFQVTF